MKITEELNCVYGSRQTKDTVYVYNNGDGSKWYVVDGSVNVNLTFDPINDGVNVEELRDVDCFTWNKPIESIEEFEIAVES
jgi:hypothetical protein